jgi:NTE family protein
MQNPLRSVLWLCAIAIGLSSCAHITNAPLCTTAATCTYDSKPQTTYRFSPKADRDTLIVVTFSGGGARAATLALGTLEMLNTLDGSNGQKLLDQVDIISSVSGGSVTAGWYALKGREGLPKNGLTEDGNDGTYGEFLKKKWTLNLAWDALNPVALARYTFSSYERSEVLSDFFAKHLFQKATFADVLKRYNESNGTQPYVILNATDLGHETIFPFTQGRFDFLCSNLLKYRVSDAVAASSNFPLAFSPMGLENFSGCDAQGTNEWKNDGPPQWVEYYNNTYDGDDKPAPHSYGLTQVRAARQADDYLQLVSSRPVDKYIHLLDGGVADNLGIRSTLALEDDPARVPGLYLRLGPTTRPEGYQNIQRVLYIVVNARNRNPGLIDTSKSPPGEISTAFRMADTLLDTSTLADQDFLISELEATANRTTEQSKPPENKNGVASCKYKTNSTSYSPAPFISCKPEAQSAYASPTRQLRFYVVAVDFEMIPDKKCRDDYWSLGTNWGLEKNQVVGLDEIARVILTHSDDLKKFYEEVGDKDSLAKFMKLRNPSDWADPCSKVSSRTKPSK